MSNTEQSYKRTYPKLRFAAKSSNDMMDIMYQECRRFIRECSYYYTQDDNREIVRGFPLSIAVCLQYASALTKMMGRDGKLYRHTEDMRDNTIQLLRGIDLLLIHETEQISKVCSREMAIRISIIAATARGGWIDDLEVLIARCEDLVHTVVWPEDHQDEYVFGEFED